MILHTKANRALCLASLTVGAVLASGCDTTVKETTDTAKSFGTSVGASAKEAGLKVGDAFNKTFRTKKGKDEASAEIKKAEPAYEEPKKQ